MKRVNLPPDNLMFDVTCFNFSSMLSSLMNDKCCNKMSNLVVNSKDPFGKYVSPTGKLGEVNSGHWYHDAYKSKVKDSNNGFLIPIIIALDKTTISNATPLHIFIIMLTTITFKQSISNQANAWRPLGYIPIDRNYYSQTQWNAIKSELKSLLLLVFFDIVLQSFRVAQKEGTLKMSLTLRNQTQIVNLKVPLTFIINDIQGGDGICGSSV